MTTEFDDSTHFGIFVSGTTLTSSTGNYVRQSEMVLSALRAQGVFDNMEDGTTAPATDKLWLDKNTDPAVLKEYDSIGSAWVPMTFERLFSRQVVTDFANVGGTANAITVDEPTVFISGRIYGVTATAANTGATTLQVTGVGTYDVVYPNGSAIAAGEFSIGQRTVLLFTSGRFEIVFGGNVAGLVSTNNLSDLADIPTARDNIGVSPDVATRAALKALDTTKDTVAYLTETGREGMFIFQSGDFSTLVTADGEEGIYVKADDTASIDGAWVRQHDGYYDPRWFGAAFDGGTDDTDAFNGMRAIADITLLPMRLPEGTSVLTEKITFTAAAAIYGAGCGKTILQWGASATSVGIRIELANEEDVVTVQGLSFIRSGVRDDGVALEVDASAVVTSDAINPRQLTARDLHFSGVSSLLDNWAKAIHTISVNGIDLDSITIAGSRDATATPPDDTNVNYGTGIHIDQAVSGAATIAHLTKIGIYRCETAIDIYNYEGVQISNFELVANTDGIKWRADSLKPHLHVGPGHISSYRYNIDAQLLAQSMFYNVVHYIRSDSSSYTPVAINLDQSSFITIGGNHFGLGTNINTGIAFTDCDHCVVAPNNFQGANKGISISADSSDITISLQNTQELIVADLIENLGGKVAVIGGHTVINRTTNQALSNAAAVGINWEQIVSSDFNDENWNISPSATRLTARAAGRYLFEWQVEFASNATGYREIELRKNGTAGTGAIHRQSAVNGASTIMRGEVTLVMAQDEYVNLWGYQNSGGALNVLAGSKLSLTYLGNA